MLFKNNRVKIKYVKFVFIIIDMIFKWKIIFKEC